MKTIKVEDQEILSLAKHAVDCQDAMHYWTRGYMRARDRLFDKILEKHPMLKKGEFAYAHETNTIEPYYKEKEK